jgi:hypothetical protein
MYSLALDPLFTYSFLYVYSSYTNKYVIVSLKSINFDSFKLNKFNRIISSYFFPN